MPAKATEEWQTEDFDKLNWHDSKIESIRLITSRLEFVLEMQYVTDWKKPLANEKRFRVSIAPALLMFRDTYNLRIDITTSSTLSIDRVSRKGVRQNPRTKNYEWDWLIECQEGEIGLVSSGFTLRLK